MEMPSQSAAQEAKQLNITLEREGDEWIAILPSDLKSDDEVGFPAPSEQEALDEARAYRSIEQSSVYKFEYDEKQDQYIVTFGKDRQAGKYLAPTYAAAQRAYAAMINQPEPPKAQEPAPVEPKQRRKRSPNGSKAPDLQIPQAITPDDWNRSSGPVQRANITSGIGDKPTQLAPPSIAADKIKVDDPWTDLNERITNLENIMRDAIEATAKALEGLNKR